MSVIRFSLWWRSHRRVLKVLLPVLFAAGLPLSIFANLNIGLAWNASTDTNVTGYNIYYGTNSQSYSNSMSVGSVTSMLISNVPENTTYFFAATAHNQSGQQGPLSSPAAFIGVAGTPDSVIKVKALPKSYSSDSLNFSLDSTAPPGATINPTNGTLSWIPSRNYASTTNFINVTVTDPSNPAMNLYETVVVILSDYLEFGMGSATVSSGGATRLPITVASSSSVTNIQVVLNWPGIQLLNPTLTFYSPIVSGSLQKLTGQLILQLQTSPSKPLIGTNLVAQINFLAASGMHSTVLSIPTVAAAGSTVAGANYNNILAPSSEVVVVGSSPLLRPKANVGSKRSLGLYANVGTYQLQYTTSLAKPVTWKTLMTYAQTNLSQTVALSSTNPVIYYRLHQL